MGATVRRDPTIDLQEVQRRSWGNVLICVALTSFLPLGLRIIFAVALHTTIRGRNFLSRWPEVSQQLSAGGSSPSIGIAGLAVGLWVATMLTDRHGPLIADVVQLAILRRLTAAAAIIGAIYCWGIVLFGEWRWANAMDQLAVVTCALVLGTLGSVGTVEAHERTRWIQQAEQRAQRYRETAEEDLAQPSRVELWMRRTTRPLTGRLARFGSSQISLGYRPHVCGPVLVALAGAAVTALTNPARVTAALALATLYMVLTPALLRIGQELYRDFLSHQRTDPRARWVDLLAGLATPLLMLVVIVLLALAVGSWRGFAAAFVQSALLVGFFVAVSASAPGRAWVSLRCKQLEESARANAGRLKELNAEVRHEQTLA